jgi:hypothetical protein
MRARAIVMCAFLLISSGAVGQATYKTLLSFDGFHYGDSPYAGLVADRAGNLYGVAAWGQITQGTIFQLTPSQGGWTATQLYAFDPYQFEGGGPIGGLAVDGAGNVYGTTSDSHGPDGDCGTVFKLARSGSSWDFSYLHHFYYGATGCHPEATLTYSKGRLRGTTINGGSKGQGALFSMDTSGGSFDSDSFSGITGRGYGTTYLGGGKGKGNIYLLNPQKGLTTKHSFRVEGSEGYFPVGDLLSLYVGGVRTIYGTTSAGGVGNGGAVYRLIETMPNSNQWRIKVLHSFSSTDGKGWAPLAGLTADAAGNLYGTNSKGGDWNCGSVYKLSPGRNNIWKHTVIYSFNPNTWDGCYPTSGVVIDGAGHLFGTTMYGGDYTYGAVYEIVP